MVLASLGGDLQVALEWFTAECEATWMRISTSKFEAMVLSHKRVEYSLQLRGVLLPQLEEFKNAGDFMSEGRGKQEIDIWFGAVPAMIWTLHMSIVVKR